MDLLNRIVGLRAVQIAAKAIPGIPGHQGNSKGEPDEVISQIMFVELPDAVLFQIASKLEVLRDILTYRSTCKRLKTPFGSARHVSLYWLYNTSYPASVATTAKFLLLFAIFFATCLGLTSLAWLSLYLCSQSSWDMQQQEFDVWISATLSTG